MAELMGWLPTNRNCECSPERLNCLSRKELFKLGSTVININVRHRWEEKHPARFIPELPERYIKLFSHTGETVLDPFCGSGTTNVVAKELGLNSIGIDVNPFSVKMSKKRLEKAKPINGFKKTKHSIILGDNRKLSKKIPDKSIDLIVTSPPYFDVVDYNHNNKNQFGNIHDYSKFLNRMRASFLESYRVLKKDRFMVVNTQDLYKKVVKAAIHSDYIHICEEIGFELYNINIYILNYSNGGRLVFGYPRAYYPKNDHEFNLIFRKI